MRHDSVRPAAVARDVLPGDARALAAEVDDLLGGVGVPVPRLGYPKALVVPHAGYSTRADRRARLRRAGRGARQRAPRRAARPHAPRGGEGPCRAERRRLRHAARHGAHRPRRVARSERCAAGGHERCRAWLEHSLEVQLPFLQKVLGEFALAPFAVGQASVQEVAEVIERLWGGPETLIVVSTDMSHYHSYEQARAIDGATIERIAAFATDIDHEEACGATPLNGLLFTSRKKNLALKLLSACNSATPPAARGGWSAIRPLGSTRAAKYRSRMRTHPAFARPRASKNSSHKPKSKNYLPGSRKPAPRSSRSPRTASCAAASAACACARARRGRGPERARRGVPRPALPGDHRGRVAAMQGRGVAALDAQAAALRRRGRPARAGRGRRGYG